MPNDLCVHLIAALDLAPGGARHHVVASLPGAWVQGQVLDARGQPVEAWLLSFSDCELDVGDEGWEGQRARLSERWAALDAGVGPGVFRDQRRWWPEGVDPVPGPEMLVANIYWPGVPDEPLHDPVSPEERRDVQALWLDVLQGRRRLEEHLFVGLLKEAVPADYARLFGELPQGGRFIARMERFFADHDLGSGHLLNGEGVQLAYVAPLARHAASERRLVELGGLMLEDQAKVLDAFGHSEPARVLRSLDVVWVGEDEKQAVDDAEPDDSDEEAEDAQMLFEEVLAVAGPSAPWGICLREAGYGLAASFELRAWLLSSLAPTLPTDLEALYLFWRGGGWLRVHLGMARVYRED